MSGQTLAIFAATLSAVLLLVLAWFAWRLRKQVLNALSEFMDNILQRFVTVGQTSGGSGSSSSNQLTSYMSDSGSGGGGAGSAAKSTVSTVAKTALAGTALGAGGSALVSRLSENDDESESGHETVADYGGQAEEESSVSTAQAQNETTSTGSNTEEHTGANAEANAEGTEATKNAAGETGVSNTSENERDETTRGQALMFADSLASASNKPIATGAEAVSAEGKDGIASIRGVNAEAEPGQAGLAGNAEAVPGENGQSVPGQGEIGQEGQEGAQGIAVQADNIPGQAGHVSAETATNAQTSKTLQGVQAGVSPLSGQDGESALPGNMGEGLAERSGTASPEGEAGAYRAGAAGLRGVNGSPQTADIYGQTGTGASNSYAAGTAMKGRSEMKDEEEQKAVPVPETAGNGISDAGAYRAGASVAGGTGIRGIRNNDGPEMERIQEYEEDDSTTSV